MSTKQWEYAFWNGEGFCVMVTTKMPSKDANGLWEAVDEAGAYASMNFALPGMMSKIPPMEAGECRPI